MSEIDPKTTQELEAAVLGVPQIAHEVGDAEDPLGGECLAEGVGGRAD